MVESHVESQCYLRRGGEKEALKHEFSEVDGNCLIPQAFINEYPIVTEKHAEKQQTEDEKKLYPYMLNGIDYCEQV